MRNFSINSFSKNPVWLVSKEWTLCKKNKNFAPQRPNVDKPCRRAHVKPQQKDRSRNVPPQRDHGKDFHEFISVIPLWRDISVSQFSLACGRAGFAFFATI